MSKNCRSFIALDGRSCRLSSELSSCLVGVECLRIVFRLSLWMVMSSCSKNSEMVYCDAFGSYTDRERGGRGETKTFAICTRLISWITMLSHVFLVLNCLVIW